MPLISNQGEARTDQPVPTPQVQSPSQYYLGDLRPWTYPMSQTSRAIHWCFTLNNPTIDEHQLVDYLEDFGVTYAVFQLEEGENGTPHYQGYVAFKEKQRLSALNGIFGPARPHWEVCRGTPTQNRDYCTKKEGRIGDFCEIGELPVQKGKRTDLSVLHTRLQQGLTSAQYVTEFFDVFQRNPKLVENYLSATLPERDSNAPFSSWLLVGPPGLGKSRLACALSDCLHGGVFRHCLGKWFDGYRGERTIIFDDFCGSSLPFSGFKRIFDRYPVRVEIKGTSCNLAATNFIITSNFEPKDWWKEEVLGRFGHDAITRRIGKVVAFCGLNQFRLYPSYAHYFTDLLRPRRDGEIFFAQASVQEVYYEEETGKALFPEELLQAQVL